VQTVVSGGHSWQIVDNTTGQVMGSRGGYQWNVNETDDVCIYSDGCYSFEWTATSDLLEGEYIAIYLDGELVAGGTDPNGIPTAFNVPAIGGACAEKDG